MLNSSTASVDKVMTRSKIAVPKSRSVSMGNSGAPSVPVPAVTKPAAQTATKSGLPGENNELSLKAICRWMFIECIINF